MNIDNPQAKSEFEKYEERMKKAVEHFRLELSYIRAGRANKTLLDRITVNAYGTPTPISQVANISVPEARLMTVAMYDPSLLKEASRAIQASDLGITPVDDGKIIRLVFPTLTEEKRRDLVKQIKKMNEDFKVTLRNERRDLMEALKKLKKDSAITEDDLSSMEKEVQKLLDKYLQGLEKLFSEKEKELMEI